MKEQPVRFQSSEISLDGLLALPDVLPVARAAVVCHPHPLYGGAMRNNVVEAALEGLWRVGFATLRFNFRGVGASERNHDEGRGESKDAQAAVRFLLGKVQANLATVLLAGYSFGAMVALRAGPELIEVNELLAIAPPIAMGGASGFQPRAGQRVTLLCGDIDSYCPVAALKELNERLGLLSRLEIFESTDHFFVAREQRLAASIESLFQAD